MAPPSRLPRHGDVRPAAPADRRALPAGARRLGRGKRGLAHVERRRRRGPPALRRIRRRGCRLGCSRPGDRQPGRADRGGPSTRRRGGHARRRVHVAAVPVPRATAARRHGPGSAAGGAGRLDRVSDNARGLERGAVVGRAARRQRCRGRGGGSSRSAHGRRRHASDRVAAGAARPRRRDGLLGLQVAVLPSRHGLHGGVASGVGWLPAERRQLVRRR